MGSYFNFLLKKTTGKNKKEIVEKQQVKEKDFVLGKSKLPKKQARIKIYMRRSASVSSIMGQVVGIMVLIYIWPIISKAVTNNIASENLGQPIPMIDSMRPFMIFIMIVGIVISTISIRIVDF